MNKNIKINLITICANKTIQFDKLYDKLHTTQIIMIYDSNSSKKPEIGPTSFVCIF